MIVYNVNDLPSGMVTAAAALKAAKADGLRIAFEAAIKSDVFMSFEEKIDGLFDAMSIPISDDKSYNQFYIHSEKDLAGETLKDAIAKQIIPVLPTVEQIHAEAQKRYDDKAAKDKRLADKRAAKATKSEPVAVAV